MTNETLLGYRVERNPEDTYRGGSTGYWLHGPRGARYSLIRSDRNPGFLFAWNDRSFGIVSVKGNGWFTDGGSELKVA